MQKHSIHGLWLVYGCQNYRFILSQNYFLFRCWFYVALGIYADVAGNVYMDVYFHYKLLKCYRTNYNNNWGSFNCKCRQRTWNMWKHPFGLLGTSNISLVECSLGLCYCDYIDWSMGKKEGTFEINRLVL